MELTAYFSYVEQISPPTGSQPLRQRFDDGEIVLTIREVTADQAPIAILVSEQDYQTGVFHEPVAYRWCDGRLWTDRPVSGCPLICDDPYPVMQPSMTLVSENAVVSNAELGIYFGIHDGKQSIESHLRKAATDWLIVDGVLHRSAGEPLYVVIPFGKPGKYGRTALLTADSQSPNFPDSAHFAITDLEEARQHALSVAKKRKEPTHADTDPGFRFEVLMPTAIQCKSRAKAKSAHDNA